MDIPAFLDFSRICRCCLLQLDGPNKLKPLFSGAVDAMLREVVRISVEEGDALPDQICVQCILQISRAFTFHKQCKKSDLILRSYLSNQLQEEKDTLEHHQLVIDLTGPFIELNCDGELNVDPSTADQELSHDETEMITANYSLQQEGDALYAYETITQHSPGSTLGQGNTTDDTESFFQAQGTMPDYEQVLEELNSLDARIVQEHTVDIVDDSLIMDSGPSRLASACDMCSMCYETIEDLMHHRASAHPPGQGLCTCDVCGKTFETQKMIRRHMKTHRKSEICTKCGASFSEKSNLTKHMRSHTGVLRNTKGKPFTCKECGKQFKWATSLQKHGKIHTGKGLFSCDKCPKVYSERKGLKMHSCAHATEPPIAYTCATCGRKFSQEVNLKRHNLIHTKEKPYQCTVCNKCFRQPHHLHNHIKTHNNDRPPSKHRRTV